MSIEHLFTQALGLISPWKVVTTNFDPEAKSLELVIDFERGARFPDPDSGQLCPVHDTVQRCWEHLRFFEHRTTIRARVPRITSPNGSVKTVEVPWAKPNGGFTLLMEAYLLTLAKVLPVAEVSRQTNVSQDRIWHLIRTRVDEAWRKSDWSSLERLGVDETSTRKGHKYGTVFLEIDGKIARAISIREFLADFWNYQHRADAEQHLKSVISWCSRSRMEPFVKLAKTLKSHMNGILGYYKNYTTSAAVEAINGLLQLARRRARGFRKFANFQAMAYWIAGGLTIDIPETSTH